MSDNGNSLTSDSWYDPISDGSDVIDGINKLLKGVSQIYDKVDVSSPHLMGHFAARFLEQADACRAPDVAGSDCIV